MSGIYDDGGLDMMPSDMFDELETIVYSKFQDKDDSGDVAFVEGELSFFDVVGSL